MAFGLLDMFNTPQEAPMAPQSNPMMPDGGFMGFLKSPRGKGLLYGAGLGLLSKLQDRNAPLVPIALQGAQQFESDAKKQQLNTALSNPEVLKNPAMLKQLAPAMVTSDDPKVKEFGMKLLFNDEDHKPYTLSAGQTRYDSQGNPVASIPARKTGEGFGVPTAVIDPATGEEKYVQVDREGHIRDLPSIKPINKYDSAFQKAEINVKNKLLQHNGISDNKKSDEILNGYLDGSFKTPDGKPLKPLSPSLYNDLSDYMKRTSTTATISKAQRANTAHAEMEAFQPFIKQAISEAGDRIVGVHPEMWINQFKNDDESQKKLGRAIAANTLSNAMANAINTIDFGEAGEGAVSRILESTQFEIKSPKIRLSSKARQYALDFLLEQQKKALNVRNRYGVGAAGAVGVPMLGSGGAASESQGKPEDPLGIL